MEQPEQQAWEDRHRTAVKDTTPSQIWSRPFQILPPPFTDNTRNTVAAARETTQATLSKSRLAVADASTITTNRHGISALTGPTPTTRTTVYRIGANLSPT